MTNDNESLLKEFINDFNEYAWENNLDIQLELNLSTIRNDYDSTFDYLFSEQSNKYDIYLYDVQHSRKYTNHFINLADYLKKEHIEKYENDVAPQICKFNEIWISLPLYLTFTVLYSNIELLNEYDLDIPKT
ncbi:hypothetical protein BCR36DRAFT_455304 [Piromyces finnis]|uniref:Uncharacterized protein n=1 Tax=Piromyces finnis TaxID=1754191 RepID=A0A1Y1V4H9_9FUNG|nr:hypothetical protein BCR36DRAFT_455304 [Piromyces finnis]|eukprot:ORX46910.1 hypothetical protein BCR36DRAFT_455304 [Piromyces finnis]